MPEPADRRASERFPVTTDTSCSFIAPVAEDFGPAKIQNLSMEGIGLLLSKRVEPGTLLTVTLSNSAKNFIKTLLVRVVHVTTQRGGSLVGGTLETPLTYQEFTSLVM